MLVIVARVALAIPRVILSPCIQSNSRGVMQGIYICREISADLDAFCTLKDFYQEVFMDFCFTLFLDFLDWIAYRYSLRTRIVAYLFTI
jgi:hypothetical protein